MKSVSKLGFVALAVSLFLPPVARSQQVLAEPSGVITQFNFASKSFSLTPETPRLFTLPKPNFLPADRVLQKSPLFPKIDPFNSPWRTPRPGFSETYRSLSRESFRPSNYKTVVRELLHKYIPVTRHLPVDIGIGHYKPDKWDCGSAANRRDYMIGVSNYAMTGSTCPPGMGPLGMH
jgi:hypothetical protein